jgi:hypothetical protein
MSFVNNKSIKEVLVFISYLDMLRPFILSFPPNY